MIIEGNISNNIEMYTDEIKTHTNDYQKYFANIFWYFLSRDNINNDNDKS